jgi:hypothetical protein
MANSPTAPTTPPTIALVLDLCGGEGGVEDGDGDVLLPVLV